MPPKRKAPGGITGVAKAGKGSTASTPGPGTPRSIGSSDQFSDEDPLSETEEENIDKAINKFSLDGPSKRGRGRERDATSRYFGKHDFSYLHLKPDHQNRPLWIDPERGLIILESFHPLAAPAADFLVTIAEPQSRPTFLHEYSITPHSLYAAVSVGLNPQDIINTLNRFLKTPLGDELHEYILRTTGSFGKVKLVLKNTKYYLESNAPEVLQLLLKDPIIGPLRVHDSGGISTVVAPRLDGLVIPGTKNAAGMRQAKDLQAPDKNPIQEGRSEEESEVYAALNEEDEDEDKEAVQAFEIQDQGIEIVQKRCLELQFPALEEYDFRNDRVNATLDIDLRPATQIRPYQEKSLSKMFGNGRAKKRHYRPPVRSRKDFGWHHRCMHHPKGRHCALHKLHVRCTVASRVLEVVQHQSG